MNIAKRKRKTLFAKAHDYGDHKPLGARSYAIIGEILNKAGTDGVRRDRSGWASGAPRLWGSGDRHRGSRRADRGVPDARFRGRGEGND